MGKSLAVFNKEGQLYIAIGIPDYNDYFYNRSGAVKVIPYNKNEHIDLS